jgi:RND family efflux transporter MFP subunit
MSPRRIVPFVSVLLALAVTACDRAPETVPLAAPISAPTARAEARSVPQRIEVSGSVEAERSAAISSRVMANVVAVRVKAGDAVHAGQVLVEIDPQTAKGQEAQARGALAQAEAGYALAEKNFQRYEALAKSGAASPLELDMARMQFEQAKGAREQGRGALEAASSVSNESRVVAPFAGRVTARLVEAGDFAAPGRPLVMLESGAGRRLAVAVPASVATSAGLRLGGTLPVNIDGVAGVEREARIVEMSPGADPASHTFTVKLELSGPPVASGLTGRAWISSGTRDAVLVPAGAVVSSGGLDVVVVKDAEGKARSRAVTLGERREGQPVEVLAGLSGGETVLLGLTRVPPDGAPVSEVAR